MPRRKRQCATGSAVCHLLLPFSAGSAVGRAAGCCCYSFSKFCSSIIGLCQLHECLLPDTAALLPARLLPALSRHKLFAPPSPPCMWLFCARYWPATRAAGRCQLRSARVSCSRDAGTRRCNCRGAGHYRQLPCTGPAPRPLWIALVSNTAATARMWHAECGARADQQMMNAIFWGVWSLTLCGKSESAALVVRGARGQDRPIGCNRPVIPQHKLHISSGYANHSHSVLPQEKNPSESATLHKKK